MRCYRISALSVAAAIALTPAPAGSHVHAIAPVAKVLGGGHAIGGAASGAGLAIGFVGGVAVLIGVHEATRKRCNERRSTWVDPRHDVNAKPARWSDPCKRKLPKASATAKLWPNGK